jgi:hypothetical protein
VSGCPARSRPAPASTVELPPTRSSSAGPALDPVARLSALAVVVVTVALGAVRTALPVQPVLPPPPDNWSSPEVLGLGRQPQVEQGDRMAAAKPRCRVTAVVAAGSVTTVQHRVVTGQQVRPRVAEQHVTGVGPADAGRRLLERAAGDRVLAVVAVHDVRRVVASRWSSPPLP